jgi:hypothetical protein
MCGAFLHSRDPRNLEQSSIQAIEVLNDRVLFDLDAISVLAILLEFVASL